MKMLLLAIFTFSLAHAQTNIEEIPVFSPIEIKRIVGDFPAPNSTEESLDDQAILKLQETRTEEQCQAAAAQDDVKLVTMFPGIFTAEEIKELDVKLWKVKAISAPNILLAKNVFRRPRPYKRNRAVIPCIPKETSYAYPSGHTAIARLYARVLSKMYPAKRKVLMQAADQAALNRVLGGVHHPTDIVAGKKFGDELFMAFF